MSPTYSPSHPMPEEARRQRDSARGRHLGTVVTEVYENEVLAYLQFPGGLPEDLEETSAVVVQRARVQLANWR